MPAVQAAEALKPYPLVTLKKRRDFVRLNQSGHKFVVQSFILLWAGQEYTAGQPSIGVGYTVTKKIGGAVVRNRVKRRLREAVREGFAAFGESGYDYVFIARANILQTPYSALLRDVKFALERVERRQKSAKNMDSPKGGRRKLSGENG